MEPLRDEELMLRYRDGDASAFDALYGRHRAGLFRFILRQCPRRGEAEEIFQEVWMKLIEARSRYRVEARFSTYLYQIAVNRLIDRSRHKSNAPAVSLDDPDCPASLTIASAAGDPLRQAAAREECARLLAALAELPAEQREAFLLREEGGLSVGEIAEVTKVGPETAKSRLRYALQKLRQALGERDEERGQGDDGAEIHAEDVSRVYRRAAREEPPPELDATIEAAAVRAAGSRRSAPRASRRWWGVPIAVAATIVIGVSIAFLSEQPDPQLTPLPDAALTRAPQSKQQPSPAASRSDAETSISTERAAESPRALPDGSASGPPPVAASRDVRPGRERTARDLSTPRREVPTAPSETPSRLEGAGSVPAERLDSAPLAAPKSAGAPEAPEAIRKSAPAVASPATEEMESLSPEMWLQRIRELRGKGDLAHADAGLRAFRHRYPDYPLPADLVPPAEAGH